MGKALRNRLKKGGARARANILLPLPYWIASLLTGLVAVAYTKLFGMGERLSFYLFHLHEWLIFIVTPVCFLLARWVVKRFAVYAKGSGIPQVMAAVELANPKQDRQVDKLLSIKVMIVKIISSLLMIIGGGAIGREGPTIHIAGCIFRKVNQLMPKSFPKISKRNMIMTGAAAGLAAAFNTPLGGIVFAVEELTKTHLSYFKIAILSAVIIAGLTAQGILGPYLYLGFPDVKNLSPYIFLGVILVAAIAGLMGAFLSKLILAVLKWKEAFKNNASEIIYVLTCALVVASIAYFISNDILGSGKEQMSSLLFSPDKNAGWVTPGLRTIGPLLSFTTGASGGIFAPSLSAGATLGSLVASWFDLTATNTNIIILAGMVAFLTGITRSPFTSAILVLEMTDRHTVIFHLMIAGIIAVLVSSWIDKRSLYDHLKHQYLRDFHEEEIEQEKPAETKKSKQ
ncbi:MAG: chloride channel protein [Ferruginibacter sp.]